MNPLYVHNEYKQRVDISANWESKFSSKLIIHFLFNHGESSAFDFF